MNQLFIFFCRFIS